MSWSRLSDWWLDELQSDPAYEQVVTPLVLRILDPRPGNLYLDLGSGEGRAIRAIEDAGAKAVGVELNESLAGSQKGTAVGDVSALPVSSDSVDGAFAVLVLEHLPGIREFFEEAARVVKKGGTLGVVANHPIWTAPNSTPIQDEDGEVLWRPGDYFGAGETSLEVDGGTVTFHHRSLADLLNAASAGGWSLETMAEAPHHQLKEQAGIPRLFACRWRLLP